jgi:hypothetical protein
MLRSWFVPPAQSGMGFGGTPGALPASPDPVTLPAVPSGPLLPYQQFQRFEGNSSHQKSVPFGSLLYSKVVPGVTSLL